MPKGRWYAASGSSGEGDLGWMGVSFPLGRDAGIACMHACMAFYLLYLGVLLFIKSEDV